MRTRWKIGLLSIVLAVGSFGSVAGMGATTNPYSVWHYSVEDGLSQNTVMAILQDDDGYMWFGTWDGLNRFDGYTFTTYKSSPRSDQKMQNSRIHFIYEDALHYIWIQTYDGNIHRFDKHKEEFYSLDEPLEHLHNHTHPLYTEPRKGELWFAGIENILRINNQEDPASPKVTRYSLSRPSHFLVTDSEGNVWYDDNGALHCIDSIGNDSRFVPQGKQSDEQFMSCFVDKHSILFGTDKGCIWRLFLQDKRFERIRTNSITEITDIQVLDDGSIMFSTSSEGFFVYDVKSGRLQQYSSKTDSSIRSNQFISIDLDSRGVVWLENTEYGIFRYRTKDGSLKHLRPDIDERYKGLLAPNFLLIEDLYGNTWVNPNGGGFGRYNYTSDELEDPIDGLTNMIHTAYSDRNGILWISTYDKGIDQVNMKPSPFNVTDIRMPHQYLSEVRAICELSNGDVLMANKGGNVLVYDSNLHSKGELSVKDLVYCIHEDSKGNVWFGTRGSGLMVGKMTSNGVRDIRPFETDSADYALSSKDVYSIAEGKDGTLYIGTYGGGVNILRDGRFIHSGNRWADYPLSKAGQVRDLLLDDDSVLWAATTKGLLRTELSSLLCCFMPYYDITCLHRDKQGQLWCGSYGAGLNKVVTGDSVEDIRIEICVGKEVLGNDIILNIVEDEEGVLWLVSERPIMRYSPIDSTFQYFNPLNRVPSGYFSEASALQLQTGLIVLGYNSGFCSFMPQLILHSDDVPPLMLTKFELFNKEVEIGGKGSPLKESISYTNKIVLRPGQEVFSIEFAALDFEDAGKIRYAYMLEGFEDDWNYVNSRRVTYTNLPNGTYRFCVRSTNAEGIWTDNMRELTIKVLPTFWETGWAVVLYIVIAVIVLMIALKMFSTYSDLQHKVQLEQTITDIKLRFFTNISHELRTPLTLISGPVENILKTERISQSVRDQLEIVQNNCNRMLRLINEILDFRKIQNKKMRLKIQETDLAALTENTCANFSKEAYDKHITFEIENRTEDLKVWVDKEKVDIILYNILSNAFKFTPAGKKIKVVISQKPNFAIVQVSDEGVGIPSDKRSILFERFTSQNEIKNYSSVSSTGIGLNLVKELVDMHKGYIEVNSELNKGTTFSIMFRLGKEHFGNEVDFISYSQLSPLRDEPKQRIGTSDTQQTKEQTLLIVEDNQDMREFLSKMFQNDFQIKVAHDGKEGLEITKEVVPDIIISDLMMPNMDGLELTEKIKEDPNINHIPVILLTAKSNIESRLDAMRYGADDYITKPFSSEYLKARVENILKQRSQLQENYRKTLLSLQPKEVKTQSPNDIFIAKLMDFMERNMDNNDLIVEDMVSEMALGRTVFFNKLKSLTGLSPVEFIREVRIKRAAQLLKSGTYNITEITYMVGMNDSRYFSKCFKAVYGMTPTEYKKRECN